MILRSSRRAARLAAVLLACTALQAIPASAQQQAGTNTPSEPQVVRFGTWGVDTSTRDTSVKPGDDFQRYANGKWMDTHEIPADKSQNGVGSELADRNQEQLRAIVMGAPKDSQLGAFYASYMDEARVEQLDAAPLKADLDRVDAIKSKAEFARFMADTHADFGAALFGLGTIPDPANPAITIAFVGSGGMGLPDRDYYLVAKYKPQRDAYRAYVQRTLELTGTAERCGSGGLDPRVRDRDRQGVVAGRRPARHRQDQQSDDPGAAPGLCPAARLERLYQPDPRHVAEI